LRLCPLSSTRPRSKIETSPMVDLDTLIEHTNKAGKKLEVDFSFDFNNLTK